MILAAAVIFSMLIGDITCQSSGNETALVPTNSQCTLRRISQVIRKTGCVPKRIISYYCVGGCPSYSEIVPNRDNQLRHNCECCKESGVHRTTIQMTCQNIGGLTGSRKKFRKVELPLAFPTSCMCRPCVGNGNYQAQEFRDLAEDVKRLWSVLHA